MIHLFLTIIGDFHPLIVHFPIGIFGLIAFSLILYKIKKIELPMPFFKLINGLCLSTLILAVIFGVASENSRSYSGKDADLLEWHEKLGFVALFLYFIAFFLLYFQEKGKNYFKWYVILFILSFLTMSFGGHLGSTIVHGEIKLLSLLKKSPQPKPVTKNLNTNTKPTKIEITTETKPLTKTIDFKSQILPIFEENCFKCHGPEKQKGDLRLDTFEYTEVITPFSPEKSELLRLISLPEDDKDVMPSKGELLSPENIKLIHDWILQGAKISNEENQSK
jgi:uncharacterized membrane protein